MVIYLENLFCSLRILDWSNSILQNQLKDYLYLFSECKIKFISQLIWNSNSKCKIEFINSTPNFIGVTQAYNIE
jgi:hypothetical protein